MSASKFSITLPSGLGTILSLLLLLIIWEVMGGHTMRASIVPAPSAIMSQIVRDGTDFYLSNLETTARAAVVGFFLGTAAAIGLAATFVLIPALERVLMRVAVVTYAIPMLAIGPLLQVTLRGDDPKVGLAIVAVFFTTLVGALLGFRSCAPLTLDLVRAFGGGRLAQLRIVMIRAALPSIMASLQIAAPASFLGAVVAEYFGSPSGLGIAMVSAQESLQIERTWALAIIITACSGAAYALIGAASSVLLPRLSGVDPRATQKSL